MVVDVVEPALANGKSKKSKKPKEDSAEHDAPATSEHKRKKGAGKSALLMHSRAA